MTIRRWLLVTRRRDGAIRVQRFLFHKAFKRAYRLTDPYVGENPIIEVWFVDRKGTP